MRLRRSLICAVLFALLAAALARNGNEPSQPALTGDLLRAPSLGFEESLMYPPGPPRGIP
jgi:hypothetical protein